MEQVTQKTLAVALVAAQRSVRAVEKLSKNQHHGYKYASAEDIIEESRRALAENGLAFMIVNYLVRGEIVDHPPAMLVSTYALIHESGEEREIKSDTPIVLQKGRPADKAVAAAKTYDEGYTLRALLLLPRVEEGLSPDQRDDTGHAASKRSASKPPPKAPELTRAQIATMRMVELAGDPPKGLGVERCREVTSGMPRRKTEDKEAIVVALEAAMSKKVAPVSEAVGGPRLVAIAKLWALAGQQSFSDMDVSDDLRELYGKTDPTELTAEELHESVSRYEANVALGAAPDRAVDETALPFAEEM